MNDEFVPIIKSQGILDCEMLSQISSLIIIAHGGIYGPAQWTEQVKLIVFLFAEIQNWPDSESVSFRVDVDEQ